MGIFMSRIMDQFYQLDKRILLVGLDAAGKTTILYQLNARRFDGTGERLAKAAAFAMGQANLLPQLLLGTLMWVLVETRVVGCAL